MDRTAHLLSSSQRAPKPRTRSQRTAARQLLILLSHFSNFGLTQPENSFWNTTSKQPLSCSIDMTCVWCLNQNCLRIWIIFNQPSIFEQIKAGQVEILCFCLETLLSCQTRIGGPYLIHTIKASLCVSLIHRYMAPVLQYAHSHCTYRNCKLGLPPSRSTWYAMVIQRRDSRTWLFSKVAGQSNNEEGVWITCILCQKQY